KHAKVDVSGQPFAQLAAQRLHEVVAVAYVFRTSVDRNEGHQILENRSGLCPKPEVNAQPGQKRAVGGPLAWREPADHAEHAAEYRQRHTWEPADLDHVRTQRVRLGPIQVPRGNSKVHGTGANRVRAAECNRAPTRGLPKLDRRPGRGSPPRPGKLTKVSANRIAPVRRLRGKPRSNRFIFAARR